MAAHVPGDAPARARRQRHARHFHPRLRALGPERARGEFASLQIPGRSGGRRCPRLCERRLLPRGKTPKKLGEEMAAYVKAGFRAVKMKVGRLSPKEEEARVKAAREAIGPEVELMLDANNAWHDLPTAMRYMERFELYDPYWIEEPFFPDDIDNHARLAKLTRVTVATGEIGTGRWHFKEILDKGAAQILQTDALVWGGVTEWRKVAASAASYGVTVCPHWFHDLHAHLVAATPNARYVEFCPDNQVLNFRRLVDTQLKTKDGMLILPKTPGLGFGFDEKAVARYGLEDGKAVWKVLKLK